MRGSRFCYYLMVVMFIYTILIRATSIPLGSFYDEILLIVGIFFGAMVYSIKETPKGIIDTVIYNNVGIDCELNHMQRLTITLFFISVAVLFIGIYSELNCWTYSGIISNLGFMQTVIMTGTLVYLSFSKKEEPISFNRPANDKEDKDDDYEDSTKNVISELIYTGAIALLIGAIELRIIHF